MISGSTSWLMWLSGRLGKEVLQEIEKQIEMLGVRQASLRYTDDEMAVKDWRGKLIGGGRQVHGRRNGQVVGVK